MYKKLTNCNNKEGTNMIERTTIIVSKETSAKLESLKSFKNSSKESVILDLIGENEKLKKIINSNEKAALAFKIYRNKNNKYELTSFLIEKNELRELKCIATIEDKNFAEYMLEIIENHWNNHRKILRFVDVRRRGSITKYCEFHDIEELDCYFDQYEKEKNNNLNNLLKYLEDEEENKTQELKQWKKYLEKLIQEKIEEMIK